MSVRRCIKTNLPESMKIILFLIFLQDLGLLKLSKSLSSLKKSEKSEVIFEVSVPLYIVIL